MIIKAFSSIFDRFHCSFNYAFSNGVWSICFSSNDLQASGYYVSPSEYMICFPYSLPNDFRMIRQLAYSYVLKCEHQESSGELVLWRPKAMHHCLRSELLFHLL